MIKTIKIEKKSIIIIILLLSALGYIIFKNSGSNNFTPNPKSVESYTARKNNINESIYIIAKVKPIKSADLISRATGIFTIVRQPGQESKKGDVIAKIENKEIESNYILLKESEAIAKSQYDRSVNLMKKKVSSKDNIDDKKNSWIDAQKRLAESKIAFDNINIYAPFDGVVGMFNYMDGSQVKSGDDIVKFYDISKFILEFDVPSEYIEKITDKSFILLENNKHNISYIQKVLDNKTNSAPGYATVMCKSCIGGSSVEAELVISSKDNVITTYEDSILFLNGKTHVYTIKDSKAVPSEVQLGIRNKDIFEVLSGLKDSDIVIRNHNNRLYPQADVTTVEAK